MVEPDVRKLLKEDVATTATAIIPVAKVACASVGQNHVVQVPAEHGAGITRRFGCLVPHGQSPASSQDRDAIDIDIAVCDTDAATSHAARAGVSRRARQHAIARRAHAALVRVRGRRNRVKRVHH